MYRKLLVLVTYLIIPLALCAQSADDFYKQARTAAFDNKDYVKAINLSKIALEKSPEYSEIRVFLGRLYTWSKKTDSARTSFKTVITQNPKFVDAYLALGNLEYWNDNNIEALKIVNNGLVQDSGAEELLLLKAKILDNEKEWTQADEVLSNVLKKNPSNTDARALSMRIKDNSSLNKMGIGYNFVYFDKQFDQPWHLAYLDYTRQTKLGSITGRFNYANRFNNNGTQFEIDAYPRISSNLQAYVNLGYGDKTGVFARYRAGVSLFTSLPLSFEAEAGFRFLRFSDDVWIYTASVGKYYKNFWFNFRTYLTPSNESVSQSFSLTTRYYLGGADDYLSIALGTGVSPDDQRNNVLIGAQKYKLKSNNISLSYRMSVERLNIFNIKVGLDNQEYLRDTKGNQLDIGLGYIRRF
ncbi:YaiO family outer membrane beta-barrel protein [Pedobacter sp.]|uniref:YaiO family outer membrane beta-barrel protein n=1 Tax=Pedobacter sp. TaxID=1411316 RepID=UPI003BA9F973